MTCCNLFLINGNSITECLCHLCWPATAEWVLIQKQWAHLFSRCSGQGFSANSWLHVTIFHIFFFIDAVHKKFGDAKWSFEMKKIQKPQKHHWFIEKAHYKLQKHSQKGSENWSAETFAHSYVLKAFIKAGCPWTFDGQCSYIKST